MSTDEEQVPESVFLNYSIRTVLERKNDHGVEYDFLEPWASEYVDAIRARRYGDAIWARYHITRMHNRDSDDDETVIKEIEQDAREYRENDPDEYADAILFYADNSSADGHPGLIETIMRIAHEDASKHHAKVEAEERAEAEAHLNWIVTTFADGEAKLAEALDRVKQARQS
ncbi:hypothetical protein Plec18170_005127 [Paecilomyces lecythidis]